MRRPTIMLVGLILLGALSKSFAEFATGPAPDAYNAANPSALKQLNDLYTAGEITFSQYQSKFAELQKSVDLVPDAAATNLLRILAPANANSTPALSQSVPPRRPIPIKHIQLEDPQNLLTPDQTATLLADIQTLGPSQLKGINQVVIVDSGNSGVTSDGTLYVPLHGSGAPSGDPLQFGRYLEQIAADQVFYSLPESTYDQVINWYYEAQPEQPHVFNPYTLSGWFNYIGQPIDEYTQQPIPTSDPRYALMLQLQLFFGVLSRTNAKTAAYYISYDGISIQKVAMIPFQKSNTQWIIGNYTLQLTNGAVVTSIIESGQTIASGLNIAIDPLILSLLKRGPELL